MRKVVIVLLCLFFCGCGLKKDLFDFPEPKEYRISDGYKITPREAFVNASSGRGYFIVEYRDFSIKGIDMAADLASSCIYIHINRATLSLANTETYFYILEQEGNSITARHGRFSSPNSDHGGNWWNTDMICLYEIIDSDKPLDFYIIDKVHEREYNFRIEKM